MFDLTRRDTICAPATANAPSAIALIRVSGKDAPDILQKVFAPKLSKKVRPFVATLGDVLDHEGKRLDEGLCTYFPEGKSFTGEHVFELSIHGGLSRVQSVMRALKNMGCRLADAGEFTLRAVLTGRIDLTAAEGIADVIEARSDEAARVALKQLEGGLKDKLAPVRNAIIDVLTELEARLDFPDEELGENGAERLSKPLQEGIVLLERLLEGAALGMRLRQGARVVLYGAPNAGKSTLLNALLGEERAIVHDSPGTTRDVLDAESSIAGVPVTFVDVAGIRDTAHVDPVEKMGIERALKELQAADLVLICVDASREDFDEALRAASQTLIERGVLHTLPLLTKSDLTKRAPEKIESMPALLISAKLGAGIDALKQSLAERLGAKEIANHDVLLTRERQRRDVERARDALVIGKNALARGEVHEVVASELRDAGRSLDALLGMDLNEDVLDSIFTRFCIGK